MNSGSVGVVLAVCGCGEHALEELGVSAIEHEAIASTPMSQNGASSHGSAGVGPQLGEMLGEKRGDDEMVVRACCGGGGLIASRLLMAAMRAFSGLRFSAHGSAGDGWRTGLSFSTVGSPLAPREPPWRQLA